MFHLEHIVELQASKIIKRGQNVLCCELDTLIHFRRYVSYYEVVIDPVSKNGHLTLAHNFAKCGPVLKIIYCRTEQYL